MAEPAAQVLQHIQPDAPSAAVAQGLNPGTADPGRQVSIKDAWQAIVAEKGPVTYDQDPSAQDGNAEAHANEETKAEPESPAEKTEAKKPKPAPKPPEEIEEEETAADTEEEQRDTKFTAKERSEFIQQRRELRERFNRNERAQAAKWAGEERRVREYEQKVQSAAQQLQPLIRSLQLLEQGDFDGFAKGCGEYLRNDEMKDWNTLNSEALKAVQSPVYKKMRDLERRQEEAQKERERQAQEQQRAYQEQQKAHEIANWKRGLSEELSGEDDPAIPAIVESRPELVDAIFNIQQHHYQTNGGDLLSPRDAAVKLLSNVQKDFKFWSDFFAEHGESDIIKTLTGSQPAPKKKAAVSTGTQRTETSERRGAKAPKNVPQSQTAQASALGNMSEKELIKLTAQKMQEDFQHLR